MTITGLSNAATSSAVAGVEADSASGSLSATSAGDTSNLSEFAQLMKQLGDLATSDPAEFKQVAEQISQGLKQAAQGATGSQADFLDTLADRFSQAAQTGSMAPLKPPATAAHGGHHHVQKYAAQQGASDLGSSGDGDVASIIESALSTATSASS